MELYGNRSGNSGVEAFRILPRAITVKFWQEPEPYHYTYETAGRRHVEEMKRLARAGKGLSGYISRYVRDLYES